MWIVVENGERILGRAYVVGCWMTERSSGIARPVSLMAPQWRLVAVTCIAAEYGGHVGFAGQKLLGPFVSSSEDRGTLTIRTLAAQIMGAKEQRSSLMVLSQTVSPDDSCKPLGGRYIVAASCTITASAGITWVCSFQQG